MEVESGYKLVVAVDYGTTFTGKKARLLSITHSFLLLTYPIFSLENSDSFCHQVQCSWPSGH